MVEVGRAVGNTSTAQIPGEGGRESKNPSSYSSSEGHSLQNCGGTNYKVSKPLSIEKTSLHRFKYQSPIHI